VVTDVLVLDASVAVRATRRTDGFAWFSEDLVAPPLLWSEARSVFHEALWRRETTRVQADEARRRLDGAPVKRLSPPDLGDEAWRVADELGWAKTYDAEYVALARLLGCRLVTLDARLHRGTRRLGFVVAPEEV